jgi:hypothetical protein
MKSKSILIAGVMVSILSLSWLVAEAQKPPQLFVYPQKGQKPEQQEQDEFACYKWAKTNSGVDPMAQPQAKNQRAGGTLRGGAGGAALGAAGGAIAGDAGKGAAIGAIGGAVLGRRRGAMNEQRETQMTTNTYHRAFAACMEGRGYTVK